MQGLVEWHAIPVLNMLSAGEAMTGAVKVHTPIAKTVNCRDFDGCDI